MEEKGNQLKDTTIFLMIFTALLCDALQTLVGWIPVVGNIIAGLFSIFIFLTFFLWFQMNGIRMITPKRLTSMIGGGFVEMIPFVNILPAWTLVVVYLVGTTKIKELAAKHPTLAKGAVLAGTKIKTMNKTGQPPHVPGVDEKTNKKTQPDNKQKEEQKQPQGETQKIDKEISEIKWKIDYLQKEVTQLEPQIATMNSNELLKQQSAGYFGKLNDMENRVRTMKNNIRTAQVSLSELERKRVAFTKKQ